MSKLIPVRGKRLRITRLEDDGTTPAAATPASMLVTAGFITFSLSPVIEGGDEFRQKNANGDLCVDESSPDQFTRFDLTAQLCGVDTEAITMLTGQPTELDGAEPVGYRTREGSEEQLAAVELWTGLGRGSTSYGYLLLPRTTGWRVGQFTVENGAVNVTLEGGRTQSGQGWGVGPYDVVGSPAGPLSSAIVEGEHHLFRSTEVAPPAETDGAEPMP